MRSRELPAFRSLRFGWPDAALDDRGDHVVLRTPPGGISSSGTALVLDDPPEHIGPWLLRGGGHDLLWEDRLDASRPVAQVGPIRSGPEAFVVPQQHRLEERTCYLHDAAMDPDRPEGVRPLAEAELEAAVAVLAACGWAPALARWQLGAHLRLVGEGLASVLATGAPGAPTGVVTAAWNGREARVQGLAVHPDHRRGGLGRKLLAGAATDWQAVAFGLMYALVEPGSAMEGLVRDGEMRPVTTVWRVRAG